MNNLRRWIKNWLTKDDYTIVKENVPVNYNRLSTDEMNSDSIKFTVTPANGGVIISTYSINNIKGESNSNLYVIHQNDDVAENITKIITLELLKKQ